MIDDRGILQEYSDHVKSYTSIRLLQISQVAQSGFLDMLLFAPGDGLFRYSETGAAAGFYFYKYQLTTVGANDIDFSARAAVVALQNQVAHSLQIGCG